MRLKEVFKQHVADMRFREEEQVRIAEEAKTKREVIRKERMELEHFIYKLDSEEEKKMAQFMSLQQ